MWLQEAKQPRASRGVRGFRLWMSTSGTAKRKALFHTDHVITSPQIGRAASKARSNKSSVILGIAPARSRSDICTDC
jgi:hypothetical protein